MWVYKVGNIFEVVAGSKKPEAHYRTEISQRIIERFGKGPFSADVIKEILLFCQQYYISAFEEACGRETSHTFYREIYWLHEQAVQLRRSGYFYQLPEGLDIAYISRYRRILKMILEHGCLVDMVAGEVKDTQFVKRMEPVIDELLYLGAMIYSFAESIAEQDMVEDITDISFDDHGLYLQSRRHHYEDAVNIIATETEKIRDEFVLDENATTDYVNAVNSAFNLDYEKVVELLHHLFIYFGMEPGDVLEAHKESFLNDAAAHCGGSPQNIQLFIAGLVLNRQNKMPISELVRKPHSINRMLYRPLLEWTVNEKSYYVTGLWGWQESESGLLLNAIPWGKFADEWIGNKHFKKYVDRKSDEHDKWLDDAVEKIIVSTGLLYQRKVKTLVTPSTTYSLLEKDLGEIDFMVICPALKKILVIECKHLQGRYDMVNWRNDYYYFTVSGNNKSYNERIALKVNWLSNNIPLIETHFKLKEKDSTIDLKAYKVEGVFVLNTPTFYMYNSDFRIYTYHRLQEVITGIYKDPSFSVFRENEENLITYFVKYPFFQKPKLLFFENDDDGRPVDKYGFPL